MSSRNMSPQTAKLYEDFLALSEDDREEFVALIWQDHDTSESEGEFELSPEWQDEIKRRIEESDRGEVESIPWEEVQRQMDAKYGPITD